MARKTKIKDPNLQNLWDIIISDTNCDIDTAHLRKSHTAKPWDIQVSIYIPEELSQNAKYTIRMTEFFKKHPSLDFKKVTFGKPKKAVSKKKTKLADIVAIFDSSVFTQTAMELNKSEAGASVLSRSKAHTLQLMEMFGVPHPRQRGEIVNLYLKCTPMIEGEGREYQKVQRLTQITQLNTTETRERSKVSK